MSSFASGWEGLVIEKMFLCFHCIVGVTQLIDSSWIWDAKCNALIILVFKEKNQRKQKQAAMLPVFLHSALEWTEK